MIRNTASLRNALTAAMRYLAPLALVLLLAPPAKAQPSSAVPDHGRAVAYGEGWKCQHGFREEGGICAEVAVPANGYLNSIGNNWECNRLYRKVDDACVAIAHTL